MDGMSLLQEAQAAGLTVTAKGSRLKIRGPRRAERLAELLIQHKADVLPLLSAGAELPTIPKPRPGETVSGPTGPDILRNHAIARDRLERLRAADDWDRIHSSRKSSRSLLATEGNE